MSQPISKLAGLLAAALLAGCATVPPEPPDPARLRAAQEIPIADVHMHLYAGQDLSRTVETLNRNGVRWAGGVGRTESRAPEIESLQALLGARYFPAGAMAEQTMIFLDGGAAALADNQTAAFRDLISGLETDLKNGRVGGAGELVVDNSRSSPMPRYRRKIAVDAPANLAIYALVARYRGYANIHMHTDPDNVRRLETVLQTYPDLAIVLAHCLKTPETGLIRTLLARHPNLYCDLSYRSAAKYRNRPDSPDVMYSANWLDAGWRALIEEFPDRFMLGSDKTSDRQGSASFDEIYAEMRTGILAHLSESTMRKVAHENAVRVYRLPANVD